jgi:hypothetical protein
MSRFTQLALAIVGIGALVVVAWFVVYFPASLFLALVYAAKLSVLIPGPANLTLPIVGVGVLVVGLAPLVVLERLVPPSR